MDINSRIFETLPKGSISEILIQRITDALISGELKPGDKIPTELEFSEKLGVGRNSVREAIKVLVAFGVLEIRRAEGTFVTEEFNGNLLNPIVYGLILGNKSMNGLLEFKITFLNSILYLVVQKANDKEIQILKNYLDDFYEAMNEIPGDIKKMYEASRNFNEFLAEIADNPLIIQLNDVVIKIATYSRKKAIENSIKFNCRNILPDSYKRILDLIESKDKSQIGEVIDYIYNMWKDLLVFEDEVNLI